MTFAFTWSRLAISTPCGTPAGGLGQRQRGLPAVRDGGQRGFDHTASFVELLVGDYQRNEDANHIVEGAGGDGDEAVLVAILCDFRGLGVRWLARPRVAHHLNGAHAAQATNISHYSP